jgi:hypothetical protein
MQNIIALIPANLLDDFQLGSSTIGARILFPGNSIDGQSTINATRGFNSKLNDRFDLTLECIRLHYLKEQSPLQDTLVRYSAFFELFGTFNGYVEFFLLQDLVNEEMDKVKFFLPHKESFENSPRPESVDAYLQYRENTLNFVRARNSRIQDWVDRNLS